MTLLGRAFVLSTVVSVVFSLAFLVYMLWLNDKCEREVQSIKSKLAENGRIRTDRENEDFERILFKTDVELAEWSAAADKRAYCREHTAVWHVTITVEMALIVGFVGTACIWATLGLFWCIQRFQMRREEERRKWSAELEIHRRRLMLRTRSAPSGLNEDAPSDVATLQRPTFLYPEILVETGDAKLAKCDGLCDQYDRLSSGAASSEAFSETTTDHHSDHSDNSAHTRNTETTNEI